MKNDQSIHRIIQIKDIHIGNNLKMLRKNRNLKQTEMVARLQLCGIDLSAYSYNRIEKGTQNPTVSFLFACCQILGCDMNSIFGYEADNR